MNEPFFPLPIPREPENGLAALLSAILRRVARRRPRARRPVPDLREPRLAARAPRRSEAGARAAFPLLPPPAL